VKTKPVVIVLHGPSGVGKDTVIDELRARTGIHRAISSNTRAPRKDEQDGVDYHFLSREEFKRKVEAGEFLEWAEVYDDLKGLEAREVLPWLRRGEDVIIRTDIQGARKWQEILDGAILVLLAPESIEALREQLTGRGSEDDSSIEARLAEAEREMAEAGLNDYVVINRPGEVVVTVTEIEQLINRERTNADRPIPRLRDAAGAR
jgi:guanylate kinase